MDSGFIPEHRQGQVDPGSWVFLPTFHTPFPSSPPLTGRLTSVALRDDVPCAAPFLFVVAQCCSQLSGSPIDPSSPELPYPPPGFPTHRMPHSFPSLPGISWSFFAPRIPMLRGLPLSASRCSVWYFTYYGLAISAHTASTTSL